ncbi:hypothetical protein ACSX1A_14095 [Pontibacter sp. MBLB2868]|uniref:hypothetical protein n=1 Tax=Pontibacter sp. MBLB2868 TaxID=3451555 RepID=UPI003F74F1F6
MKTKLALFLLLLTGSFGADAQVLSGSPKDLPATTTASVQTARPLVLINDTETAMGAFILKPEQIASVNVYKEESALAKFGNKAKQGAVVINLKKGLVLAGLEDIYRHFQVPQDQRQLQIAINDTLVPDKKLLLADIKLIDKIELKTQDVTAVNRISFNEDQPYINIVTSVQ